MPSSYSPSSRYSVDDNNQTASRTSVTKVNFRTHRVRSGDTMDRIAHLAYGDVNRWWEIADMNPQVKFPLDLTPGQVLRIPL